MRWFKRTAEHEQEILADPHTIDACYQDGEGFWTLICSCQWEAWGHESEQLVRILHQAHQRKPLVDDPVAA